MCLVCFGTDDIDSVCVTDLTVVVDAVCCIAVNGLTHASALSFVLGRTVALAEVFAVCLFSVLCIFSANLDVTQATAVVFVVGDNDPNDERYYIPMTEGESAEITVDEDAHIELSASSMIALK